MISKAEMRAVEVHKYYLSQRAGFDVGMEYAMNDWLASHALAWRRERQERMLTLQREEIMRYKWIESEKANCDLGKGVALEWIRKYAGQWRAWYEGEYEDGPIDTQKA
jgi:hypothetical protein